MRKENSKHPQFLICLLLVLGTLAVYGRGIRNDFVNYDDYYYITNNPNIQHGLTAESIKWAFTTDHASNWHPLTWISHIIDWQLFGPKPMGHHLMSLVFHILNTLLLFLLLCRMTGYTWRSGLVAALFAIHPLHVESVAWAAERKDVLSAFFWMLTVLAYVGYVRRPGTGRYLLIVALYALGLMSKPMLVTLPLVLLMLDYWPLGRTAAAKDRKQAVPWGRLILEKTPLLALSASSCVVTYIVQQRGGAVPALAKLPFGLRVENALVSYVAYIGKMLWPAGLAVFYPHRTVELAPWQPVASALALLSVTILALRAARSRPYLLVGWLWYGVTLFPVIGLAQVGGQAMADRYTYVPLIGLFVVVAWAVPEMLIRQPAVVRDGSSKARGTAAPVRPAAVALASAAGLAIAALMVCTWFQVGVWRDNFTLYKQDLDNTSRNYLAHHNLGLALDKAGKLDEAIQHYQAAVAYWPDYAEAHGNLGVALVRKGMLDEAQVHLKEVLRIRPDDAKAHNNLAVLMFAKGRYAEAWKELHESKRLGYKVFPGLVEALKQKMPDPGEQAAHGAQR